MSGICIGIDLGTTFSCVGYYRDGQVEIFENGQGNRTTPSWVAFTKDEKLVGDSAKNQATTNVSNTIFDIKRLMGMMYQDEKVQNDLEHLSYNVIESKGLCKVRVDYKGEKLELTPTEISAMILTHMKEIAEQKLGEKVSSAVITVPAYFNDSQRQATKDAGKIAGLEVKRIINEPTAAAMAYGLDKQDESNVLIFDLGGGTFDVSILNIEDGTFQVLSTSGDCHLGGEDFDNILVSYVVEEFKKKSKIDINSIDNEKVKQKILRRIKNSCERAKRTLSSCNSAEIYVESIYDNKDLEMIITRAKFEELCKSIFQKIMKPVEQALKDSELDKSEINEIVLVGGSSRIPKIQEMLSQMFGGKKLNNSINPDEAVAYGAAVQAAILSGVKDDKLDNVLLNDITSLSLGIEESGGKKSTIIPRNTNIPCSKSREYGASHTSLQINIYEGEREFVKDCNKLGEFLLEGLPKPKNMLEQTHVKVMFEVDADGIITVSAKEKSSGVSKNVNIKNDVNRFSQSEIDKMVEQAEKFKEDDAKKVKILEERQELERCIKDVEERISDKKNKFTELEIQQLDEYVNDANDWLNEHDLNTPLDTYTERKRQFYDNVMLIYDRYDFEFRANQNVSLDSF